VSRIKITRGERLGKSGTDRRVRLIEEAEREREAEKTDWLESGGGRRGEKLGLDRVISGNTGVVVTS